MVRIVEFNSVEWWRRRALTVGVSMLVAGVAMAGVAGCAGKQDDTPAGLDTAAAQSLNKAQFSDADVQAKTRLEPQPGSFLYGKNTVTTFASTTPANGDVNPYAIWPVSQDIGSLRSGDVLVSNFNNKSNNQGTGTTIVNVHPDKSVSVFASIPANLSDCPGGVGLTTAMVVLKEGWLLVGSLPSTDGKIDTAGNGCLITVDPTGRVAGTLTGDYLTGPWDAVVDDRGDTATLFVTNTFAGVKAAGGNQVTKGDVVRLTLHQTPTSAPQVTAHTVVADGLPERQDASAFIKGPTGLALDSAGTLYVGDNLGNRVAVVDRALTRTDSAGAGTTLSSGGQLANPLGMALAPNGNILVANATNGKIVEITPAGKQIGEFFANEDVGQDPPGNGDLFGIAVNQTKDGILLVNDDTNTLSLLH
ncbi:hypothetical protein HH308_28740 [Gordonia sp. TBRC 11910]|uniref:NHL repeat-containing protein n=1 Tax=Gordonia asplenii TaxID=2725283 RepID=A0A848L461_9ACTN|nr:hypothetical protein [Gordonia asplenii]NMO05212.1 hypothetical protein [Gordonia asplenii]